ncbi:MAG: hypothetical protein WD314_16050 [Trueperaceae bacterium]
MTDTQPRIQQRLAGQMVDFARACGRALEGRLLIDGTLPPVVTGYRLGQQQRDDRPHMGGSDAENGAHFSAFLALLRRHLDEGEKETVDRRVVRSVLPYLRQRLVPFPHRAVLETLWAYGPLADNALWHRLDPEVRESGLGNLFDVGHYFDADNRRMRTLPDNYLWITAQNALLASRLLGEEGSAGSSDAVLRAGRTALGLLLDKLHADPWFDDKPPDAVIDQYAWETVAAAVRLCREYDWPRELERLLPIAQRYLTVFRLLARADGYAVCWGRSQGIISYGTTIYVVLGLSPLLFERGVIGEAELSLDLDTAVRAFETLKREWFDEDGLTTMHRGGRQPYSYRGPHRLVGSTFGMLVKILHAAKELEEMNGMPSGGAEGAHRTARSFEPLSTATGTATPSDSLLPEPGNDEPTAASARSHWESFREPKGDRRGRCYGLWIARSGPWHVALPLVGSNTSFEPKLSSNYLPSPLVPFLLDVPTQQSAPYGTEFIELTDGSVWSAAEGCDEVEFDANRLTLHWTRLLNVNSLELASGIAELSISYELRGDELCCEHSFSTERNDIEHRYSLLAIALPRHQKLGERHHRFRGRLQDRQAQPRPRDLELELQVDGPLRRLNVENTSDLPAGHSFLGPLPWTVALHLPAGTSRTRMRLTLHVRPPVVL